MKITLISKNNRRTGIWMYDVDVNGKRGFIISKKPMKASEVDIQSVKWHKNS